MNQASYEPGYHSVQPGQTCRIITIQIAVSADARPSAVSDEISSILTGGIENPESCILDWGYLPGRGPEGGNLAKACEQPVENEIFEPERKMAEHHVTFDPEQVRKFIAAYILGLQRDIPGFIDPDELETAVESRLEALVACALQAGKPEPKPREYRYIVVNPTCAYALVTDTGYGPNYDGPYSTEAERDAVLQKMFAAGELCLVEDVAFCLDYENGKLVSIWMPEEPEARDE